MSVFCVLAEVIQFHPLDDKEKKFTSSLSSGFIANNRSLSEILMRFKQLESLWRDISSKGRTIYIQSYHVVNLKIFPQVLIVYSEIYSFTSLPFIKSTKTHKIRLF